MAVYVPELSLRLTSCGLFIRFYLRNDGLDVVRKYMDEISGMSSITDGELQEMGPEVVS